MHAIWRISTHIQNIFYIIVQTYMEKLIVPQCLPKFATGFEMQHIEVLVFIAY